MREITKKDIERILTTPFIINTLKSGTSYITSHDDHDGDPYSGMLDVVMLPDGDMCIKTLHKGIGYLRFRQAMGGGKFLKIRNALLILAEAIRQEGALS